MPPRGAPSRGGSSGRGRGGSTDSPHISPHVTTVGVKRPNFGTVGRDLAVYVNSFKTTIRRVLSITMTVRNLDSLQLVVKF
jgi:eukaryotic translation initiation factor 2C